MLFNSISQKKHIIMNMINHLGPISRTALIDLTGFRPATVGAIAGELLADNLIVETENISVGHGRKRVLLDINKSHICSIGISIAPRHITFIVAQFDGKILLNEQNEFNADSPSHMHLLDTIKRMKQILADFADKELVGIGICKFLFDNMARIETVDRFIREHLEPELAKITPLPINIFSEVSLPAVAEQRFGIAKGINNLIWVNLTDSINVSLYCNGTPITGANHMAGQLGHTVVSSSDKLCTCGKPGCVEGSAAWPALYRSIQSSLRAGIHTSLNTAGRANDEFTYWDVRKALDEGDRMCSHHAKASARQIGLAIANLVNILNPEMIVLHGFMLRLGKVFMQELEQTIYDNVIPAAMGFEIKISNSFENPMLLGVVAEVFSAYLMVDDYRWVYQLSTQSHE